MVDPNVRRCPGRRFATPARAGNTSGVTDTRRTKRHRGGTAAYRATYPGGAIGRYRWTNGAGRGPVTVHAADAAPSATGSHAKYEGKGIGSAASLPRGMHPLATAPGEPYNEGQHQAVEAMHGQRRTASPAAAVHRQRSPAREARHQAERVDPASKP